MDKRIWQLRQYLGFGLVIFGFSPIGAYAGCPQGQEAFTSCQIEGRATEVLVCYDHQVATYSYGPIGGVPDLFLSETIARVDFKPWSGVGKEISESVTFYSGAYSYEVVGGFDRPFSEEEMLLGDRHFGWLEVAQNGERLSRLECIADTVTYGFGAGIYDAKVAAGLVWDDYSKIWLSNPDHPAAPSARAPILIESTHRGVVEDCLPPTEFKLGGIMMGDRGVKLGTLGAPEVSEVVTRGPLEVERFIYDGLRIDIFRGAVMEMETTTTQWEMPSGLKVGLTRGEVISILGRVPNGGAATSQRFDSLVCLGSQDSFAEWYAVIAFGQDERVESISFASLSP